MAKNLKKFFLEVELSDKNEPFLFVVHGKITHDTTLAAAEKVKASAPLKTSHQTSPNFFSNSRNVVKNRRLTLAEQLSVLEKKFCIQIKIISSVANRQQKIITYVG